MEVHDGTVWDGATEFAALEPVPDRTDGTVAIRLVAPVVVIRDAASALVDALGAARVPAIDVGDELVRAEARARGWTGPLRAPLAAPRGVTSPAEPAAAVDALLPDASVTRRGLGRGALSLRATSDDGLRLKVKVFDRPDVVPELLAAALDTAFAIRRRFGRMASGVHAIAIDDGAGGMDDHRTLGSTQSQTGTFFLDTSLVCADAIDAQRRRMAGRRGVSAATTKPWFPIDGVVAHEYWHNLDTTVVASPAVYLELNRALGAELGVETYEQALRGREGGAPPAWKHALARIVTEVSPYATTNWRESTAELFKLWWCAPPGGPPSSLVACFGAVLDRFYPPPS
jgi:hypothetical protein